MAARKRLGEMLVEAGIIDDSQLRAALGYQRQWGVRLGQALVEMKLATEADVVRALAQRFGYEVAEVRAAGGYALEQALKLVPREFALKHSVLPLAADSATLTVAMSEPGNVSTADELRFRTGRRVKIQIGGDREIAEGIRRCYPGDQVEPIALDLDAGEAGEPVLDPFGGGTKDALEAFFGRAPSPAGATPAAAAPPPAAPQPAAAPPGAAPATPAPGAPRPITRSGMPAVPPPAAAPAAAAPAVAPPAAPASRPITRPGMSPVSPAPQGAPPAGAPPRPVTRSGIAAVPPAPSMPRPLGASTPAQAPAPPPPHAPPPPAASGAPPPGAAPRPAPATPPAAAGSPSARDAPPPQPPRPPASAPPAREAQATRPAEPAARSPAAAPASAPPPAAPAPPHARTILDDLDLEVPARARAAAAPREPEGEPVLATDLAPDGDPGTLGPRELELLDALERMATGSADEPEVVKPAQAVAALLRLLLRKKLVTEEELLEELGRR